MNTGGAAKHSLEAVVRAGGIGTIREGVPDDLFISCASFEERTLAVTEAWSKTYRARTGILYINKDFREGLSGTKTELHVEQLLNRMKKHCERVEFAEGSWLDPIEQLLALRDVLHKTTLVSDSVVTLDTTTFNREALLVLTALLRSQQPAAHIRVLYVSPQSHGGWLTRGFRSVRNVIGFSGVQKATWPTVLIVLSGYEPERTLKIIEEHEPFLILLGIGDPATSSEARARNIEEQSLILSRQDVQRFAFPTTDVLGCSQTIGQFIRQYSETANIAIAPMSTKLSTLGVYIVAEQHNSIQITTCVPGEFNLLNYSGGAKNLYVDLLPPRSRPAVE